MNRSKVTMHRHKWQSSASQQARMPNGATRFCTVCRAQQIKVKGRWQPVADDTHAERNR